MAHVADDLSFATLADLEHVVTERCRVLLPFLARLHLPPNLRMIGGSSISWAASVAGAEIRPELSPQHHRDRQNPSTDLSVGGLGPPTASAASEDGVRVGKPRRSGQAPLRSVGGLGPRRCPRRASGWKLSEW